MSNSNSNLQGNNMQESRESLSFLANIATGHYFNNVFPSNLSGNPQATCQQQSSVMEPQPGSGGSASNSASSALSQYHMTGSQTTSSVPSANPSIATSAHFTNPTLSTQNCPSNAVAAGQQYLATSMSNMALSFSQGLNAMHQNAVANLPGVTSGLGGMSLPSVPGGSVCFQHNVAPHGGSFPLQVSPLQIPSPLRHPTLLEHQLLHQQQQAVTSQQTSMQQPNTLQQSIVPQQAAFMHQNSLLQQSSQSSSLQHSSQPVKQSSHSSPVPQQPSPMQQPTPAHQQSPLIEAASSGGQVTHAAHQQPLPQSSKSGKLPLNAATTSSSPSVDGSFRSASKMERSSSSASMDSSSAVSRNSANLNSNNTGNVHGNFGPPTSCNLNAAGRHLNPAMSDANQCSEMFNTIREALSVADNNPEVSSAASIFSEEPTYLNPSNCSLSEAATNQLLTFNFLTTSPYQLMCRHCGFSTDFHMVFTRHMACHFGEKGFECPLCVVVCASEEALKRHVNDHLEGRMSGAAKNLPGNVSVDGSGKVAGFPFKENNAASRYIEAQSKGSAMFGNMNDGSDKNLGGGGSQSSAGMSNNRNAKNGSSALGKKTQKSPSSCQKNVGTSATKGVKRKKLVAGTDGSGIKKSKFAKSSSGKSGKKNLEESSDSEGETSDESYSVSEGSSYSINRYHGPPLGHPNGPYNNKGQTNPKFNPSSSAAEEDFDLYNPIDPIATTNRSLSYTDFYKKHSFMSVNSGVKLDGASHNLQAGGHSFLSGTNNTASNALQGCATANTNSMNQQLGVPFHANSYGTATASNNAKMKDTANNYSIEQLSGHPTPQGLMGNSNMNNSAYPNNNLNNNFQSEPLSLIVNPGSRGAPSGMRPAPRPVTTCRPGCSHFGRTIPGEVAPLTTSNTNNNNNSSVGVTGSHGNSLNNINSNMSTNGPSTASYVLPDNGFHGSSTLQSYSNNVAASNTNSDRSHAVSSNSSNRERVEGSGSASEHITVKIDPFDVAPSVLGGARHHQGNRPAAAPPYDQHSEDSSSYHSKQAAGSSAGLNDDGSGYDAASCYETLSNSDQNSNNSFVTLADIGSNSPNNNVLTLGDDDDDGKDCIEKKKKGLLQTEALLEGGAVDSSVYVNKTHTSKYSVNYAISNKTRNLLGSSTGGAWNNSPVSRKSRKPRDYYNRGRGYYGGGGRSRGGRGGYGLGNKLAPALSTLGEPCTVEDIIDYTVGAGLKMQQPSAATSIGGIGDISRLISLGSGGSSSCQNELLSIKVSDGSAMDAARQSWQETAGNNGGLLAPPFDRTSFPLLHDSQGASIPQKGEESAAVGEILPDTSQGTNPYKESYVGRMMDTHPSRPSGKTGNVEMEAASGINTRGCGPNNSPVKVEDASKLLLVAVGLIPANSCEPASHGSPARQSEDSTSGDPTSLLQETVPSAGASGPSRAEHLPDGGSSDRVQAKEDDKLNERNAGEHGDDEARDGNEKPDDTNGGESANGAAETAVNDSDQCGGGEGPDNNNAPSDANTNEGEMITNLASSINTNSIPINENSSCSCKQTKSICNICNARSNVASRPDGTSANCTSESTTTDPGMGISTTDTPANTSSVTPASNSGSVVSETNDSNPKPSSTAASLIGSPLLATSELYVCRICGFETHYQLVLARHAPSHHKKDGVIH